MMKETYELILLKLRNDLKGFKQDVRDSLKDSYEDESAKIFHEIMIAKMIYCEDLIEFFEDIYDHIN